MAGRGWLEGTMEVISGTVKSSRASTPTPPYRPGSLSAPSSPCPRSPGSYPTIERLPSQDALDRSLHNTSSHGKSTAQVIRDLRASNAALSAKTAEMEADFMNQVNKVQRKYEYQNKELHEALKHKEKKIAQMESRTLSTENRIRDRDTQIAKLREETAFQRNTITDLKTQLYQLQSDIEEGKFDDGGGGWASEKREMMRDMENLKRQVTDLQAKEPSFEDGGNQNVLQSWKQLEETKRLYLDAKRRMEEAQSALALAENVSKRKEKEHEEQVRKLRAKHAAAGSEWAEKESELRSRLEALECDDIELTKDLRAQVEERDSIIDSLRGELADYVDQFQELKMDLAQTKAAAASQDKYRREEAEDLRILNDAQEEENMRLQDMIEDLKAELTVRESRADDDSSGRVAELESQLAESREACESLERKINYTNKASEELVADLRKEIEHLKTEKKESESRHEELLAALEKECDDYRRQLEAQPSTEEDEARYEEMLRDVEARAEQEREELENGFEEQMEILSKAKQAEIESLERRLKEVEEEANTNANQESEEVQQLKEKLKESETELDAKEALVSQLEESVKGLESKASQTSRVKKQLREAQIALVAIDDENKRHEVKSREKLESLEKEKADMEASYQTQLSEMENAIAELKNAESRDSTRVSDLTSELTMLKTKLEQREAALDETKELLAEANAARSSLENGHARALADSSELDSLRKEKELLEKELNQKLQDRDTTISALVKSSVLQEQKVASFQAEVERLQARLNEQGIAEEEGDELMGPMDNVRDKQQEEEIRTLRKSLEDYKRVEKTLSHEISELKHQLNTAEVEARHLRGPVAGGTGDESNEQTSLLRDYQDKLQERDDAIATLVKESLAHESEISSLRRLIKKIERQSGPSWEELERLQKESEIFAGQIIEQDEEMEALKGDLADREAEIDSLMLRIESSRSNDSDTKKVADLQAELDEAKEANETHCEELRDLRKQLRVAKASADRADDLNIELYQARRELEKVKQMTCSSAKEDADLRRQLDDALASKDALEVRMSQQIESIRRLRNSAVESLESQLSERDAAIAHMKEEIARLREESSAMNRGRSSNDEKIDELELELGRLHMALEEKELAIEDAQISMNELRRALDERTTPEVVFQEKEGLTREIGELRSELASLEEDKAHLDELREKLAIAEADRDEWERGIVDSYERKISLMKLDKDVTIDGLRKELAEFRAKETFEQEDVVQSIKALEAEKLDLQDELEAKLKQKDARIESLEHALVGQEQFIDNLKSEMDQLQSTMERANVTRRAEIEEMQQEVFDSSAKATQFEREVTSLKMKLDETAVLHKLEVEKLNDKIASLEQDVPFTSLMNEQKQQEYDDRLDQVRDRLEKLQWRNNSLQDENARLRTRLNKSGNESDKATNEYRLQVTSLEEEVSSLKKKINDLELDAKSNENKPAPLQVVTPSPMEQMSSSKRNKKAMSPRRTAASPGRLRFLKRRSHSKEFSADELKQVGAGMPPPVPTRDDASTGK